jgi:hypothetical protein
MSICPLLHFKYTCFFTTHSSKPSAVTFVSSSECINAFTQNSNKSFLLPPSSSPSVVVVVVVFLVAQQHSDCSTHLTISSSMPLQLLLIMSSSSFLQGVFLWFVVARLIDASSLLVPCLARCSCTSLFSSLFLCFDDDDDDDDDVLGSDDEFYKKLGFRV